MNKLTHIETFITVINEGGFTAAAKKLNCSTAAISRHIKQLERNLNTTLLQRTTRHIQLTELGKLYFQKAQEALNYLQVAEKAINLSMERVTGTLIVTSNRYFAFNYLLPKLSNFLSNYSELDVKIELAERFPDMINEQIDIIFGVSMDGPPGLVRKRIANTRYILCASPQYLMNFGTPKGPTELTKHQFITHSMRNPNDLINFNDGSSIQIKPILWLNDSGAMKQCALLGMGIVNLHDYVVADAIADGRLVEILPEYQRQVQPVFLYYQPDRYLQPKVRQFIDFYTC